MSETVAKDMVNQSSSPRFHNSLKWSSGHLPKMLAWAEFWKTRLISSELTLDRPLLAFLKWAGPWPCLACFVKLLKLFLFLKRINFKMAWNTNVDWTVSLFSDLGPTSIRYMVGLNPPLNYFLCFLDIFLPIFEKIIILFYLKNLQINSPKIFLHISP